MSDLTSVTLHWHRLTLPLQVTRAMGRGTPVLIMLNALLKGIKPNLERVKQVKLAFHVPDKYAHRLNFRAGEKFSLQVDFFGADAAWLAAWQLALQSYLAHTTQAGFVLAEVVRVEEMLWELPPFDKLRANGDFANDDTHAELEFFAPLPFKRAKGDSRTQLSLALFFSQLARRVEQLFGVKMAVPNLANIQLQSHHWRYTELHHLSKSQPGHKQYFNGCFGSLYFSGDLTAVLPWLQLAAEIHAGGTLELNALGYCRLHHPARANFDAQLQQSKHWQAALQRVCDGHDDWEQQLAATHGVPLNAAGYCTELISHVQQPHWQAAPAQAFSIPKRNGMRRIEKLPPAELLIHSVLHELLSEPIDRTLEVAAVGFRRGLSVQTAVARVRELLGQGYRYVVESDIEDFFPAINIARVETLLDGILPPADSTTRQLLGKLLRAPYLENGRLNPRTQGLAQGSPLSPLLANLYLDRFDEAFNNLDAKLVRYADDFVILARTREAAERLLLLARSELHQVGLDLAEAKTAIHTVEEGFHFLGQPFGGAAENTVAELLMPPVKKSIYITEPGCFLGHNGDALEIRRDAKLMDAIPLRRVADIAILAPASLSSGLIQKCAKLGIPLTMTLGDGYHIASLPPDSRQHHSIAARQAVHYAQLNESERLILAKGFAAAKINNYKPLINARHGKGNAELLAKLEKSIAGIEQASEINAVRGHEGMAARLMFATLDSYIKVPEFHFKKRLRDKPDRMNVLFNFGYYLLFSRLNTMVRAAGLNPYLGFLHDGEDDYETLVCDIEELFRAVLDRHLIALVNLRVIKPDDFAQKDKGLRLAPLAIKRFLEHFERLLHSDVGGVSLLDAMHLQVRAFARYVTEDKALWYFSTQPVAKAVADVTDSVVADSRTEPVAPLVDSVPDDMPWDEAVDANE
jgi:CRISPR-associated endonuclease Cas1